MNSLNRSKSEVKRNQSNRGLLSTLNKVKNSLMSSMMILTILSFSTKQQHQRCIDGLHLISTSGKTSLALKLPEVVETSVVDSWVVVSVKMGMQ